jgi:hypothetical protein
MEQSIKVTYDRKLIRSALHSFMIKRLGWIMLVLLVALAPFLYFVRPWGDSTVGYLLDVGYLVAVLLLIIIYFIRMRQSETVLSKMKTPDVIFTFSDKGVHWRSDLGCSELCWAAFDEILKFKEYWLLVYSKSGYLNLPTICLTEDIKKLIDLNCGKGDNQV